MAESNFGERKYAYGQSEVTIRRFEKIQDLFALPDM
jgi:hypothetical protein